MVLRSIHSRLDGTDHVELAVRVDDARARLPELSHLLVHGPDADLATVLVTIVCARDCGVDVSGVIEKAKPLLRERWPRVAQWPEPFRFVSLAWGKWAGFLDDATPDPLPAVPLLAAYHALHVGLVASRYGLDLVPLDDVKPWIEAARQLTDGVHDDADMLGEMMLVEATLVPRDDVRVTTLQGKLAKLQGADGGFALTYLHDDDARHHAACVNRLAYSAVHAQR